MRLFLTSEANQPNPSSAAMTSCPLELSLRTSKHSSVFRSAGPTMPGWRALGAAPAHAPPPETWAVLSMPASLQHSTCFQGVSQWRVFCHNGPYADCKRPARTVELTRTIHVSFMQGLTGQKPALNLLCILPSSLAVLFSASASGAPNLQPKTRHLGFSKPAHPCPSRLGFSRVLP